MKKESIRENEPILKNESIRNLIVKLNDKKLIYIVCALVVVIIILVLIIVIPLLRNRVDYHADQGCEVALHTTNEMLAGEAGDMTPEQAQAFADEYGSFCPGGGHFYVVWDSARGVYYAVCGLHEKDASRRTEVNGKEAMGQIRAAVDDALKYNDPLPDAVTVRLNNENFTAERRASEPKISHGTKSTRGFSGTFICYILDEDGEISFFCYADKYHCVRWRAVRGWIPEDEE